MYPIDCSYNIRYDRVGECLKSMYCYGSFLTILRKFDKAQRALTSNPVDSAWILHRYIEDQISTNFNVISTNFFYVISMVEKSTLFPLTFFNVTLMVEKSTLFPRTFFDVVSMVEKSTLEPRTFFDVIPLVEISAAFLLAFFNLTLMVKKIHFLCMCFFQRNFDEFDVIFGKLMKTFDKVFLC